MNKKIILLMLIIMLSALILGCEQKEILTGGVQEIQDEVQDEVQENRQEELQNEMSKEELQRQLNEEIAQKINILIEANLLSTKDDSLKGDMKPKIISGLEAYNIPDLKLDWEEVYENPMKAEGYLHNLELVEYDTDKYVVHVDRNKFNELTAEEFLGFVVDRVILLQKSSELNSIIIDFGDGTGIDFTRAQHEVNSPGPGRGYDFIARYGVINEEGKVGQWDRAGSFYVVSNKNGFTFRYISFRKTLDAEKYFMNNVSDDIKKSDWYDINVYVEPLELDKWYIVATTLVPYNNIVTAEEHFKNIYDVITNSKLYKDNDKLADDNPEKLGISLVVYVKETEKYPDRWYRFKYDKINKLIETTLYIKNSYKEEKKEISVDEFFK